MPATSDEEGFDAYEGRRSVLIGIIKVALILVAIAMGSAVVLGLLVPRMAARRKRAQLEQVKENMRQLGLALHNYQQTHSQPLQPVSTDGAPPSGE